MLPKDTACRTCRAIPKSISFGFLKTGPPCEMREDSKILAYGTDGRRVDSAQGKDPRRPGAPDRLPLQNPEKPHPNGRYRKSQAVQR